MICRALFATRDAHQMTSSTAVCAMARDLCHAADGGMGCSDATEVTSEGMALSSAQAYSLSLKMTVFKPQ